MCVVGVPVSTGACTTYFEAPTSATPTATATPDLWTFTSQIARGGYASRSFRLTNAGTVQVTLTSLTPSVPVGLGVGIPESSGGGCSLARSIETTEDSMPQLSVAADAGDYCVKVFDIGQIEQSVSFSLTTAHP
jgi:hypothetical protein